MFLHPDTLKLLTILESIHLHFLSVFHVILRSKTQNKTQYKISIASCYTEVVLRIICDEKPVSRRPQYAHHTRIVLTKSRRSHAQPRRYCDSILTSVARRRTRQS